MNVKFIDKVPAILRWILYLFVPYFLARIAVLIGRFAASYILGSDTYAFLLVFLVYDGFLNVIALGVFSYILIPKKNMPLVILQPVLFCIYSVFVMGGFFYTYEFDLYSFLPYILWVVATVGGTVLVFLTFNKEIHRQKQLVVNINNVGCSIFEDSVNAASFFSKKFIDELSIDADEYQDFFLVSFCVFNFVCWSHCIKKQFSEDFSYKALDVALQNFGVFCSDRYDDAEGVLDSFNFFYKQFYESYATNSFMNFVDFAAELVANSINIELECSLKSSLIVFMLSQSDIIEDKYRDSSN